MVLGILAMQYQKLQKCVKSPESCKKNTTPSKIQILTNWTDKVSKIMFRNFCQFGQMHSSSYRVTLMFMKYPPLEIFRVCLGHETNASCQISGFEMVCIRSGKRFMCFTMYFLYKTIGNYRKIIVF